jgi:hypothetical protein
MKTMKHLTIALVMAILAALAVAQFQKRASGAADMPGVERFKFTLEYEKKAEPLQRNDRVSPAADTSKKGTQRAPTGGDVAKTMN